MRVVLSLAAAAMMLAANAAHAQQAGEVVIKTRQSIMQVNQNAAELVFGMAEGDIPFDAAAAKAALMIIAADNEVFPTLFPDDSKGGKSKALPAVWEKKDAFAALSMKMAADARAAADAVTTKAALADSALLLQVGRNCTSCHGQFRQQ
jgi:cytochrome c556